MSGKNRCVRSFNLESMKKKFCSLPDFQDQTKERSRCPQLIPQTGGFGWICELRSGASAVLDAVDRGAVTVEKDRRGAR